MSGLLVALRVVGTGGIVALAMLTTFVITSARLEDAKAIGQSFAFTFLLALVALAAIWVR